MDTQEISISEEELIETSDEKNKMENKKTKKESKIKKFFSKKRNRIIFAVVLLLLIAGGVAAFILLAQDSETEEGVISTEKVKNVSKKYYDNLTGELLSYSGIQYNADGTEKLNENGEKIVYTELQAEQQADNNNMKRISCIQIPNGTDARPQVGLTEAKIVIEAIAEGGITRFAALYRGATSNVIGPVRSLRSYYLQWDDPFDCTIVHAGGEANALEQVKSYKHLSESRTYMWRDYSGWYAPNILFTSAELLDKFNSDNNYSSSNPKVFERMTPDESDKQLKKIRATSSSEDSSEEGEEASRNKYTKAENIYVHVTTAANYNINYTYNSSTNTYLRSYEGNSGKHMVYNCKGLSKSGSEISPKRDCGEMVQVAPKVVVVIKVAEQLNRTNLYREDVTTTGSGEAYIFQNGIVITGTWEKENISSQLVFKDSEGEVIKLAPGQTFITAIAKSYGYVKY